MQIMLVWVEFGFPMTPLRYGGAMYPHSIFRPLNVLAAMVYFLLFFNRSLAYFIFLQSGEEIVVGQVSVEVGKERLKVACDKCTD